MANKPYCIDIFQGDDVSDAGGPLAGFQRVKASYNGIALLYHKATQSTGLRDSRLGLRYDHWMDGVDVPVTDVNGDKLVLKPKFGFYHYNGILTNVQAEVDNFLGAIKPYYHKGDEVCFDWEPIGASGFEVSVTLADAWCSKVEDALGVSCTVYGGNAPREQFQRPVASTVVDRFSRRRLWFCNYNAVPAHVPAPWQNTGVFLWQDDGDQYGPGPHVIPGMVGYCDNSTVTGAMTVARVAELWGT